MENNTFCSAMIVNHIMLNTLRKDKKITFAEMEEKTSVPEGTIKNILLGKTKNPGGDTMNKICKSLGISVDDAYIPIDSEMIKSQFEIQGIKENEVPVVALKEIYEHQITIMKETNEAHVSNIRTHYGQNIDELKQHNAKIESQYEKILESKDEQIKKLEKSNFHKTIIISVFVSIFVILFIMEIMHPEHGWLRY